MPPFSRREPRGICLIRLETNFFPSSAKSFLSIISRAKDESEGGKRTSSIEKDGKKKGQKKWAEREIRFNDRLVRRRDRSEGTWKERRRDSWQAASSARYVRKVEPKIAYLAS